MLSRLHEALRESLPEAAALADRNLPDFVAGSVAPDGLRFIGAMGKWATHFYAEDREETWGKAVAGMFAAHPEIADPRRLPERDVALVMGYISHLTVDEAFRDTVTYQTHGMADWRKVVRGLWSMVDELPVGLAGLSEAIDAFRRDGAAGFIDRATVGSFLDRIRPWAESMDPWELERVYLTMVQSGVPEADAKALWERDRVRAAPLLDGARAAAFTAEAVRLGKGEIGRYMAAGYAS
jgi:hypothetical protein